MNSESAYNTWYTNQSNENMRTVLGSLNPAISYAVSKLSNPSPQAKHQARLYAIEAVRTFDPEQGVKLNTWVHGQLKRLKRYNREMGTAVKVPDRAAIDAYAIERASLEFEDLHNREPDLRELADHSRLPIKRITDVRKLTRPVVGEAAELATSDSESDYLAEALDYVHSESDHVDRRIIEMTTNFDGDSIVDKATVAKKLNMNPSQITRRSARINLKIQDMERDLKEVNA